jgi:hypothetical protein
MHYGRLEPLRLAGGAGGDVLWRTRSQAGQGWGTGMTLRSAVRWMLGASVAGLLAACGIGHGTLGNDPGTESDASTVTWTDGQPAIFINCKTPGGCQSRAVAICNATGGDYTVLRMQNMPTRGDMTQVRGPASVVIRCGNK